MELYSRDTFKNETIDLFFLKTNDVKYRQLENEFIPNLSIIDVMMFNSSEEIKEILNSDYSVF